jgi:capsular exopolysaccharide synthesis family protein
VPNLYVLPCGAIPPNPAELILSHRFEEMLSVLKEYFDFIIFDSPPLTNVSDGRILASHADSVILVIKAFSTAKQLVQRAIEGIAFSRAHVAGVVLNDLDIKQHSPYSHKNYYSGYAY